MKSLQERFDSKVEMRGIDECWLWMGGLTASGYGQIRVNGRNQVVHRVAWELEYGPIRNELCCLHR